MWRILNTRGISEQRADRAINTASRYISNIQRTRQYARDRGTDPNNPNVSRMANRQYSRRTYMGMNDG